MFIQLWSNSKNIHKISDEKGGIVFYAEKCLQQKEVNSIGYKEGGRSS